MGDAELMALQVTGVILFLIVAPLFIMNVRNWFFARQSVNWPTCSGIINKRTSFNYTTLDFGYEYVIDGKTFKGSRPYFAGAYKGMGRKTEQQLIALYPAGKSVTVSYHPYKPHISVLEPGRRDGVLSSIIQLLILAIVAMVCIVNPSFITNLIG